MQIVATFKHANPQEAALTFSAILAVDKGVASEVGETGDGWLVTAEGKAVLFQREIAA